jgi:tetratricopeptide (TPR) repeat protein
MSRGLVLYDQSTNRYDLHPMVRHYGYHRLSTKGRIAAHRRLHSYFASAQLPAPETVHRLEDLAPAIACYHHAVLAKRYDEAFRVFYGYIAPALQESTGTIPLHIKLLRALCPDQQNDPPLLSNENEQAWVLATLGVRYSMSGQHRRAIAFKDHHNRLRERADDTHNLVIGLGNLAIDQIHMGELQGAQVSLQRLIQLCEEGGDEERAGTGHYELARLFMLIGRYPDAVHHLDRSQEIKKRTGNLQAQGIIWSLRAYLALLLLREQEIPREYVVEWQGAEWAGEHRTEHRMDVMSNIDGIDRSREHTDRMAEEREQVMGETFSGVAASIASSGEQSLPMVALEAAQRALELADEDARKSYPVEHDYMHAHWLLGAAYRLQGDIQQAEYHLQEAFRRCRTLNAVELQAEILLEMARVRAVAGLPDEAVRIAHEVLFITERHSYPLQGADVHLFFSHVAMAAGEEQTALDHARIARMLATCDGPPNHTYWVAYEEANAFLR